ncbi:hypothetical protein [Nocardioides sp. SLBN-35]|uniref:hypothetical protein n=1 Tax=Nocardioides sp. SLBN-35 TaxID=2768445 RepID=UPI0011548588|nr:hypothetical protein [Nocardioides sp. SLBN-35]TQK70258.1 hypothetical protein FBY23_2032 [Nocardioides sp. SLBN-35]
MSRTRTVALLSVSALATASLLSAADPALAATTASPTDTTITTGEARTATPVAATAADGSIVYIHGFNVWLSRPDGTGQRAVTVDGTEASPYEHPTMSDAGVIAVMKGDEIVRMGQDGVVHNRINPEDLFVPDYGTVVISPIHDPEISPDGTKITYSQLRLERYGGTGGYLETEALVGVTDAAQWVGPDKYGIVRGSQPSWVTNSRLTLNRSGDIHLDDLGHESVVWFYSNDIFGQFIELQEAEVSRDGKRVIFGSAGGLAMKTTVGDPRTGAPAPPTANPECYLTSDPGQPVAKDPSLGPDSDSAAYSEGGDLWVIRGLAACSGETTLAKIATGGTEPDWSPAPLSAPPAGGPGGGGPGGGGTGAGTSGHAFDLAKAPIVSGKAKVGKKLHASSGTWSPSPTSVTYTWLRNGKVVAGRTGAAYKIGKADRGKRIQVRVTVHRSGYADRSATSRVVKVRR